MLYRVIMSVPSDPNPIVEVFQNVDDFARHYPPTQAGYADELMRCYNSLGGTNLTIEESLNGEQWTVCTDPRPIPESGSNSTMGGYTPSRP